VATDRDDRRLAALGDLELIREFINTLDVLPDTDKIGDPPEDRGELATGLPSMIRRGER
jgi:hypothetical protein